MCSFNWAVKMSCCNWENLTTTTTTRQDKVGGLLPHIVNLKLKPESKSHCSRQTEQVVLHKTRPRLPLVTWFSENVTSLEAELQGNLMNALDTRLGASVSFITSIFSGFLVFCCLVFLRVFLFILAFSLSMCLCYLGFPGIDLFPVGSALILDFWCSDPCLNLTTCLPAVFITFHLFSPHHWLHLDPFPFTPISHHNSS